MMTDEFAAGFFDADGGFQAFMDKKTGNALRFRASVTNTYLPILDMFTEKYGGSVYPHNKATKKRRATWRWELYRKALVERFVASVTPHLIVKHSQAETMVELRSVKERREREAIIKRMQKEKRPTFTRRAVNDHVDSGFGDRRAA